MAEDANQEPRNPILVAIVGILNEGKDPSTLREVLDRAHAEMQNLRPEVEGTIAGLDPEVRSACEPQVAHVRTAIALYDAGMDTVSRYFHDGNRQTLMIGAEQIRRANFQLNDGLYNLRNAALLAMGPTEMPDYNFVHQLYLKVRTGELPRDGNFWSAVHRNLLQGEEALKQAQAQTPSAERDIIVGAYKAHVDACNRLRQYVREGREELLEKGMIELKEALVAIREMIPAMQMRMRTQGPTSSPIANFVINMIQELGAGTIGDQAVIDALDQLKANFADMRRQFESLARGNIESVLIQEEAAKVREALELEEAAIDLIDRFFENRDSMYLGNGVNSLIKAMKQLEESQKTFMDLADREGKTLCLRCNHYNERDRRTCDKCGAKLLQSAETSVMSTLEVSDEATSARSGEENIPVGENVSRIFDAVNKVAENEISLEQFEEELDWIDGVVEHYAASIGQRPQVKPESIPANQREQYEEIAAIGEQADAEFKEAVEYFRDGIVRYRQFVVDQVKDNLVEGTRSIWEANKKLFAVQQMTADLREKAGAAQQQ